MPGQYGMNGGQTQPHNGNGFPQTPGPSSSGNGGRPSMPPAYDDGSYHDGYDGGSSYQDGGSYQYPQHQDPRGLQYDDGMGYDPQASPMSYDPQASPTPDGRYGQAGRDQGGIDPGRVGSRADAAGRYDQRFPQPDPQGMGNYGRYDGGSYGMGQDLDAYDVDDDADYDVSFDPEDDLGPGPQAGMDHMDPSGSTRPLDDGSPGPRGSGSSVSHDDPGAGYDDDDDISDEEMHEYLAPMEKKQRKLSKKAQEERQEDDNKETRRSRKSKLNGSKAQDKKKNAAQTAKTVRIAVLVGLAIIIAIGLYQCLAPKHEWSADEISSLSQQANGDTGFPMQEGAGIAQQFIEAYLESTDSSSQKILNVFYNGIDFSKANDASADSGGSVGNLQAPSNIRQVIKAGPYLYEETATGPNGDAATYKFGALVYRVNTEDNRPILGKDGKSPDFRWLFYQVDVHYDKDSNKFVISKNSPTRVPEPKTQTTTAIPQYTLPGDGKEVDGLDDDAMQNLITTFFRAWAKSDSASMVNITDSSSLPSVTEGLNDQVVIDGNGDPSFKIYGPPSTDPYYRALVTVNWRENIGDKGDGYVQTSTYVLKLKKQGSKFIVVDVQPYKYIPYVDPEATPSPSSDGSSTDEESSGDE